MLKVQPPTTLSSFHELDDANAPIALHSTPGSDDAIITNPLDENRQLTVQQEENARRRAQMVTTIKIQRDYVFTSLSVEELLRQTTGQTLATWTIGPVTTFPEEVAKGQTLCERYLESYLTAQSQYKARLDQQARSAPVPPINIIPFLLYASKTTEEEEDDFVRWVHRNASAVCTL
uniref:Uncharacterized protein n=1 Tax=Peronospora matthiolae TaxID=2874970 RepID=A0AAV1TG29_9STRA